MTKTSKVGIGLRRETLILFPVALFILVVLSTFVLFSYRTAVTLLIRQRQQEAAATADRVAEALPRDRRPSQSDLRRAARGTRRSAILRPNGRPVATIGEFDAPPLAPLAGEELVLAIGRGPDEDTPLDVAGFTRFDRQGQSYILRVDLPADELALQSDALGILTWVVIGVSLAVAGLVFLFLRHLLRPYETLLAQAKRLAERSEKEDEITFLTNTIEQALSRLAESPDLPDDEIAALQRALGPSLESGFMLLDRDAEILSMNSVGAELLGVPSKDDLEAVRGCLRDKPALEDVLREAVASGAGVQRREVTIEGGGGERTLGVTVHALKRDDGDARGYLTLFVDLTESQRRAHEEKVAESLSQLGEMAAGVAHELRNSLATVRGYLTLIERRPEEESVADYVQEMRRESDHLQRVVDDFLTFARPETTRLEDVDLAELVERAAADPSLAVPATPRVEARPPAMRGDGQLLERALRNLLHNAAQAQVAIGAEAPLDVRLSTDGGEAEIAIRDAGGGLPAEVRERLFQPFVTGRADGVGLGLTLAHRIVTLHGGRLRLDEIDGGTRASIRFPLAAERLPETVGTIG